MAPARAALAAALLLAGCARRAAAQECDLATLFAHLTDITNSCCIDGNECSSGYPGADDACGRGCGEIFEPFWGSAIPPPPPLPPSRDTACW